MGGGSDPGLVPFDGTGGGSDPGLVPFDGTGGGSDDGPAPSASRAEGSGDGTPLGSVAAWFGGGGTAAPTRVRDRTGGEGGTKGGARGGRLFLREPLEYVQIAAALVVRHVRELLRICGAVRHGVPKRSRLLRATSVNSMYKRSSRASSERAAIA